MPRTGRTRAQILTRRVCHVLKKVQALNDYIWVENADSRYLVIDPEDAL